MTRRLIQHRPQRFGSCPAPRLAVLGRRQLLLAALAGAGLAGCGGGSGGSSPPPPPPPPPGRAGGYLVYRNSGLAAIYNVTSGSERSFDPGTEPFVDPGVAVSRTGLVSVAREGDNDGFGVAVFDLDGEPVTDYTIPREFAFQTGAAVFNADASRLALSVDEPRSASDGTRIARTLVFDLTTGSELAALDGFAEPVWAGPGGALVTRNEQTDALHLFDANYLGQGVLGGLVISSLVGGYDVSADGRYVVYSDGNLIRAHDRNTGANWVAAQDANSSTNSPTLSPDGRFLALLARDLLNAVPHVMPFVAGTTVAVDSAVHALPNTLADCAGRIGWTA